MNLFVGAIVDNFTKIKQESDGSATMTPEQQQWADALKQTYQNTAVRTPKPPRWRPRLKVFRLITSKGFEYTVMTIIVLNVFGMALDHWGNNPIDEPEFHFFYKNGMLFFTYFYYLECVLKLFALGCDTADGWCRLTFPCRSRSWTGSSEVLLTIRRCRPRCCGAARRARTAHPSAAQTQGLRDLVFTLVLAFPSLINVGCLLIVQFMYAVLAQLHRCTAATWTKIGTSSPLATRC